MLNCEGQKQLQQLTTRASIVSMAPLSQLPAAPWFNKIQFYAPARCLLYSYGSEHVDDYGMILSCYMSSTVVCLSVAACLW